jgi:uncharacterized protein DUF6632
MNREGWFKVAVFGVGLLFTATIYPILAFRDDETLQMMLSIYATLGVFLLLASRNPAAHRSLIGFAAWSSLVHAGVMAVQAIYDSPMRVHLLSGVAAFAAVGAVLLALQPRAEQAANGSSLTGHGAGASQI